MVKLKPRKYSEHTDKEYAQFERVVGGLTWDAIKLSGNIPKDRETLRAMIAKYDRSRNPSKNTQDTLMPWIETNKWAKELVKGEPGKKRSFKLLREQYKLTSGIRVREDSKGRLRLSKKGWKRSLTIAEWTQRRNAGLTANKKREEKGDSHA